MATVVFMFLVFFPESDDLEVYIRHPTNLDTPNCTNNRDHCDTAEGPNRQHASGSSYEAARGMLRCASHTHMLREKNQSKKTRVKAEKVESRGCAPTPPSSRAPSYTRIAGRLRGNLKLFNVE